MALLGVFFALSMQFVMEREGTSNRCHIIKI